MKYFEEIISLNLYNHNVRNGDEEWKKNKKKKGMKCVFVPFLNVIGFKG